MREKFPRKCDATGVGMHAGFVVCDGLLHFSEQKHLIEHLRTLDIVNPDASDEFLLKEAYIFDEYYYTEWDIDDCESWYEYGSYGHLTLVNPQESRLRDVYVLYDEEKDRLYQWENGVLITYHNYSSALYWERELNAFEDAKYKYEAIEAVYLPEHQIQRLYNQLTKSNKQTT
jgi:hypothetical protein